MRVSLWMATTDLIPQGGDNRGGIFAFRALVRGIAMGYGGLWVVFAYYCTKEDFWWCNKMPPEVFEHTFTRTTFSGSSLAGSSAGDTRHSVARTV